MEWVKAISQLLGSIAWPAVVGLLLIMFRKEIRQRLSSVTEVKYPGGSVVMKEVERLEARVKVTKGTPKLLLPQLFGDLPGTFQTDSKLAIAQMRIDVERELFRLSWRGIGESEVTGWHITRHVDELQRAGILQARLSENLRSFVEVANKILHQSDISEEVTERAAAIGGTLVSALRHKRLVLEAEFDFTGGHWHMHRKTEKVDLKHYSWSVVTAEMPEFGYEYEIYREAVERYNSRQRNHERNSHREELYVLNEFQKANEWHWPEEWGRLEWNCPIIRDRFCLFEAEQELVQTRAALERHRSRLLINHFQ